MLPEIVPLVGRHKYNKLEAYDKLKLMRFCQLEAFFNFTWCLNDQADVSATSETRLCCVFCSTILWGQCTLNAHICEIFLIDILPQEFMGYDVKLNK